MKNDIVKYLEEVEKFLTSNEIGEKTFGQDGCHITVGRTKDGFYTKCVMTNDTTKEDFKKYLDSIDDDIFTETCEYFQNKYGEGALSTMDTLMNGDDLDALKSVIKKFKTAVKEIVQSKITYLTNKYLC